MSKSNLPSSGSFEVTHQKETSGGLVERGANQNNSAILTRKHLGSNIRFKLLGAGYKTGISVVALLFDDGRLYPGTGSYSFHKAIEKHVRINYKSQLREMIGKRIKLNEHWKTDEQCTLVIAILADDGELIYGDSLEQLSLN